MRKTLILIFAALALCSNARIITSDEAAAMASDFFYTSPTDITEVSHLGLTRINAHGSNAEIVEPYYVFNVNNDAGFVIVAADTRCRRILGYSDSGSFDFSKIPPQLAAMLDQYAAEITSLGADDNSARMSRDTGQNERSTGGKVLKTANYHQGYPFNLLTPVIDNVHAPTGCVATTMAIIMKYHSWPDQSIGNSFFNQNTWCDEEHDFNVSYDWEHILDDYSGETSETSKMAVSLLMSEIGIALGNNYKFDATGAWTFTVGKIFRDIFRYAGIRHARWKKDSTNFENGEVDEYDSNFSHEEWYSIIRNEIDENRPVYYEGYDRGSGHSFVIDGYTNDNLFHINWGWGGPCNDFYALTALLPDENNETQYYWGHEMFYGMYPEEATPGQISKLYFDHSYCNYLPNGLLYDCAKIESGKPFNVCIEGINMRINGNYELGVALKDASKKIVEVASLKSGNNIKFQTKNIADDWFVQAVYKEENDDWYDIPGPKGIGCCSVSQHLPVLSFQSIDDVDLYIDNKRVSSGETITLSPIKKYSIYIPDKSNVQERYRVILDGLEDWNEIGIYRSFILLKSDINSLQDQVCFYAGNLSFQPNKTYSVQVDKVNKTVLKDFTVNMDNGKSLSDLCGDVDPTEIGRLKVNGIFTFQDYKYIACEMSNLYELDMSNAKYDGYPVNYPHIITVLHSLEVLKIPTHLTTLSMLRDNGQFCRLRTLYIPSSVDKIISDAVNCYALKDIYIDNPVPPILWGSNQGLLIRNQNEIMTIHVPVGSKERYEQDANWGLLFAKYVENTSGADSVIQDSSTDEVVELYNIQGQYITKGIYQDVIGTLGSGMYIIRQDGFAKKVVIR